MSNGKQIAKLLRKAANQHLWDGDEIPPLFGEERFSCWAVMAAAAGSTNDTVLAAFSHLRNLGVDVSSNREFNDMYGDKARQGARFLWLHFAALVAEEDGA